MSTPWGEPGATPLADIREFKREAKRKAGLVPDRFWVIAPSMRQALVWTHRNGVPLWQWQYIKDPAGLCGLRDGTIVVLNDHWLSQRAAWEQELHVLEACGVKILRAGT